MDKIKGKVYVAGQLINPYSAGSGININNQTISADETVLQHKLTAGENITISGNVISSAGGTGNIDDVEVNGESVVVDRVAYVEVPTAVSELTNDSGYITSADITGKEDSSNKTQSISNDATKYPSAAAVYNYHDATKQNADATILKQSDVVNNLTSPYANKPLSAAMGVDLYGYIQNLQAVGRFLAIWDCTTGLPTSQPASTPYAYKTGDYFRVGAVGTTNYKPEGTQYTGTASTVVETEDVDIGAVYYFDGSVWRMQAASGGGTVQDVQVNGTSVLNGGIANIPNSSNSASGVMTAAQYTKLDGIEANADVTDATNVAAAGAVMVTPQSLTNGQKLQARTNIGAGIVRDVLIDNSSILNGATNCAEIPTASGSAKGLMTSTQYTKLDGIEAGADVTDATNVEAAGAIMKTAQTLTDAEKTQARSNIGATTLVEYTGTETSYADNTLYYVVED